ncbi:MAG TPA: ATP synthase subunit I [Terriglobia bacterium]|nr:ATP synthase subunit I [Terriglobia bacterium]
MQIGTVNPTALEGAEARLPRWMVAIACLGSLVFLALGRGLMAAAFALGAGISILGYLWLVRAVKAALNASEKGVPRRVLFNLVLRYPLAFGAVLLFYETHWLPFTGVLAGLFVPFAGALVESLNLLRRLIWTEHYGA